MKTLKIIYFNFKTSGCLSHNVKILFALTLIPVVIQWLLETLLVTYCIGRHDSKIIKKMFRNKLKLSFTSVWLIILSQDSFFNISINIDTADFVINPFLTSLKLPACQSKILLTQRYWVSWSDSPLIKENTLNEFILL